MKDDPLSLQRRFLAELVAAGGPKPDQYGAVDACFSYLAERLRSGEISQYAMREALVALGLPFSDSESLVGSVLSAQRHGDYSVMESIYTNRVSGDPVLSRWDVWFQRTAAAEAVRRRKAFLIGYLGDLSVLAPADSHVTFLGCGSCREVLEHLQERGPRLKFDCIDIDPKAIRFATELVGARFAGSVNFRTLNVLRFRPERRYVRILSAGLFDYLSRRAFINLIRRFAAFLAPGGEFLIGNFSPSNATRGPMACAGWLLHERTSEDLLAIALAAGFPAHRCWVGSESSGVNLFLKIQVP